MTNEELQAHIKALNDAAAAGEIEWNSPDEGWLPLKRTFSNYFYRIKPKPREIWIRQDDVPKGHEIAVNISVSACEGILMKGVKFREVLE